MALLKAEDLINGAYDLIGVKSAGEDVGPELMVDGLRRLNMMIRAWMAQKLTIPVNDRFTLPLTASQGSYTVGTGGNWNIARPTWVTGAAIELRQGGAVPPFTEIPIAVLTDDMYQNLQIKGLLSTLDTYCYYNRTYPLATMIVWPVPTEAANKFILYALTPLAAFPDLTTVISVPDEGYEEGLEYNLAVRLAAPNGRALPDDVGKMAGLSMGNLKTVNQRPSDLVADPMYTQGHNRRGWYNIQTGQ
jgi:hypothetical protein